ncbi:MULTISPECIES: hypothetical protein [Bacillus]|uniref:hypothetical protein n=1 Tax=Bacillus TaxID=1386 RepID=UPI00034C7240|nr:MULTISPECIES: hypothetical protein [Bacillus cereus group]PEB07751.1 hypothetical protein COM56_06185 [Bacillus cereus]AWC31880.1 hypothetical protein CG482_005235 [Bacillus cytotoxicus]AWC35917.1 hypothetical protein CG481_005240 [Bacillus cytotoxicus]AWC60158.1 hypothetical protein CG474_005310 [Bacillus cytotoxicus]KMT50377.1 hypothetical protein TU51_05030 [Bacillus cytotoxicus]
MKKQMNAPICLHCEKELENWRGNVMTKKDEMFSTGVVQGLEIWCKECTSSLDKRGYGTEYHNLWELAWVKETYFDQLESLINQMQDREGLYRFSNQAVMDCLQLGRILYDKQIEVEDEEY